MLPVVPPENSEIVLTIDASTEGFKLVVENYDPDPDVDARKGLMLDIAIRTTSNVKIWSHIPGLDGSFTDALLTRDQVTQLRDALSSWLERTAPVAG